MSEHKQSDLELVEALASLLQEKNLAEIELSMSDGPNHKLRVRLSGQSKQTRQANNTHVEQPGFQSQVPESSSESPLQYANDPDPSTRPGVVVSPMVGTTYLQPEPGAAKFTEIGREVEEGQTILIVEAMKTMNHIPAPHSGTVRRIFVEDGAPVEFGAPLMIIA